MKHAYLGIDIGSISTKGVIIDEDNRFLASEYIWTEGNPIEAVRRLLKLLEQAKDLRMKGIRTGNAQRESAVQAPGDPLGLFQRRVA